VCRREPRIGTPIALHKAATASSVSLESTQLSMLAGVPLAARWSRHTCRAGVPVPRSQTETPADDKAVTRSLSSLRASESSLATCILYVHVHAHVHVHITYMYAHVQFVHADAPIHIATCTRAHADKVLYAHACTCTCTLQLHTKNAETIPSGHAHTRSRTSKQNTRATRTRWYVPWLALSKQARSYGSDIGLLLVVPRLAGGRAAARPAGWRGSVAS
jgi:hypothetical protein